ncbi:hypothetical protein DNK48_35905 [Streptomyces malaysiensis subsp. malaysiensis]|uniref:hypothetical protein n=1 Tax=Streptomyces malaysiensis TaxID=92644 RepID=UPI000BFD0404|nr:hypothetical protein [Streptomyces malaysiensis]ATL81739.1 hypothetical protein SMALA_1505 [Streptomyces malaysiensis]QDL73845.1 hypothetical protein DNK48_35905 [Streptomyces malaysiensis]
MTSIAEQAHAASAFIQQTVATSEYGPHRGLDHARTAVRLASTLGLSLQHITITPDSKRRTTPGQPLLVIATCPTTSTRYTFLARYPLYEDDAFELLGTHLATGPAPLSNGPTPDTFDTDEAHAPTCRYGAA